MRHSALQTLILSVVVIATGTLVIRAGDLNPPPGPVGPTMKPLSELESRVSVQSLLGDGTALHVIDSPGSYYLTGPIQGVSGMSGIRIVAEDVTLDLRGFTLNGVPGSLTGIAIAGGGSRERIRVSHGVIRNWGAGGIDSESGSSLRYGAFEKLELHGNTGNGLSGGSRCVVRSSSFVGNSEYGLAMVEEMHVVGCYARDNGIAGIHVYSGLVERCRAHGNGGVGIFGGDGQVSHCETSQNSAGILVVNGSVSASTADYNEQSGIAVGIGATVLDCRAASNGTYGIYGESQSVIRDCHVRFNELVGIRISQFGLVTGNHCTAGWSMGEIAIQATDTDCHIVDNSIGLAAIGIQTLDPDTKVIRNLNHSSYDLAPGSDSGPIGTAAGATNPWSNLEE